MSLADFQFQHPWASLLLLFIPVFIGFVLSLQRYRTLALKKFADNSTIQAILNQRSPHLQRIQWLLFSIAWLFAVLALMGPQGNAHYVHSKEETSKALLKKKNVEVVFIVDVSSSMAVADTRIGLNRLDYAKQIADAVVEEMGSESVSLYAMTDGLTPVVPDTWDTIFFRLMLENLSLNEGGMGGTDFFRSAVDLGVKLENEPLEKLKTALILSDGGDTLWESANETEKMERFNKIFEQFKKMRGENLDFAFVGIGSKTGGVIPKLIYEGKPVDSKLEDAFLSGLARELGGVYFNANDRTPIALAASISRYLDERDSPNRIVAVQGRFGSQPIYDVYFQYPLFFSMICLGFAFLMPLTSRVFLTTLLVCLSTQVFAEDWMPLLREAEVNLEAGQYSKANGIYQEILKTPLEPWQEAIINYDLGVTYLFQGNTTNAIHQFKRSEEAASPPLLASLEWNKAIALYQEAVSLLKETSRDRVLLATRYLKQAALSLERSNLGFCQWMADIGAPTCDLPLRSKKFNAMIQDQMAKSALMLDRLDLRSLPLIEAVYLLSNRMKGIADELLVVKSADKKKVPWKELSTSYQQDLELLNQAVELAVGEEKLELQGAKQFFEAMLFSLNQQDGESSWTAYQESLRLLNTFIQKQPLDLRVAAHLKEMRAVIENALVEERADLALFSELKGLYGDLVLLTKESTTIMTIWPWLEKYREQLNTAWALTQDKKPLYALVYLQAALPTLENAESELKNTKEETSFIHSLKLAVQQQKEAKALTEREERAVSFEGKLDSVNRFVLEAQEKVLPLAQDFVQAVLEWQRMRFHKADMVQLCLEKPWDLAIPLFEAGLRKALESQTLLKDGELPIGKAVSAQDEAIRDWEEVLEMVKDVQKESSSESQSQRKEEELIQSVIQMNHDDQAPKTENANEVSGERPW